MAKFASGKDAWAISDRSGARYRYRDMKKEWNGLLVGPDEYEPKHPQLGPFRRVDDPQALQDARPDRTEPLFVFVGIPLVESPRLRAVPAFGKVGQVTVETNQESVVVFATGPAAATGAVGEVTVDVATPVDVFVSAPAATGEVGTAVVASINVAVTGVAATGGVGQVEVDNGTQLFVPLNADSLITDDGDTFRVQE